MRYVRGLAAFWYDFLIGDRPEVFVGSIVVLAVVWMAIQGGLSGAVAGSLLTILLLLLATVSIWSAVRHRA